MQNNPHTIPQESSDLLMNIQCESKLIEH